MSTPFEVVTADEIPLSEQAAVLNQAFAGYLAGWVPLDVAMLARFLCAQGTDLCYSRFARVQGSLVAFGYINRTGNISRLAGMGTVPGARRTGAAGYLLSHLLDEAKGRGDQAMLLEVFEQNSPAHALYHRHHFRELTRLFGWRRSVDTNASEAVAHSIEEISILQVGQRPSAFEFPEMPWQISRHAMLKLAVAHAFAGPDGASVVVGDMTQPVIRLHGFFSGTPDCETLRRILTAIMAKCPNREFFAPAIFPEKFGVEIFGPLGFKREPLNQFLMRRDLR